MLQQFVRFSSSLYGTYEQRFQRKNISFNAFLSHKKFINIIIFYFVGVFAFLCRKNTMKIYVLYKKWGIYTTYRHINVLIRIWITTTMRVDSDWGRGYDFQVKTRTWMACTKIWKSWKSNCRYARNEKTNWLWYWQLASLWWTINTLCGRLRHGIICTMYL